MMLRWIAFACALTVALPVAAQNGDFNDPPIGSRLGKRIIQGEPQNEKEAAQEAHEMASCLVNRRERAAREVLAATNEAAETKAVRSVSETTDCGGNRERNHLVVGTMIRYPRDLFRGMLAEHLLAHDRGALAALRPLPRQAVYQRPWFEFTARDQVVDEMATCVAEVDPAHSRAILDAAPYSGEEKAAFAALMPVMGPCLRIGAKLAANRQALRAAIAEALYQRTQPWVIAAAPVQGAAK